MNDRKEENIKGALDFAIVMIYFKAKKEGIELSDTWGVWERIKEEYNIKE